VAGALALVGLGVAASLGGGQSASKVHAVDRPAATTSTTAESTTTTTTPPTTAAPSTTTSTRRTTTTRHPTTTTTTTATTVPARACSASQIEVSVTTDRPSYLAAEAVHATAVLTNRSGRACSPIDYANWSTWDSAGHPIGYGMGEAIDYVAGATWAAGETRSFQFTWDQKCDTSDANCPTGVAPRGRYSVHFEGRGDDAYPGRADFTLA
jgi:hypothetical protein